MAHLRPLPRCYYPGCARPATQQLYSGVNALMGSYCDQHAKVALKRIEEGR